MANGDHCALLLKLPLPQFGGGLRLMFNLVYFSEDCDTNLREMAGWIPAA